jgi:hypothetical protein
MYVKETGTSGLNSRNKKGSKEEEEIKEERGYLFLAFTLLAVLVLNMIFCLWRNRKKSIRRTRLKKVRARRENTAVIQMMIPTAVAAAVAAAVAVIRMATHIRVKKERNMTSERYITGISVNAQCFCKYSTQREHKSIVIVT